MFCLLTSEKCSLTRARCLDRICSGEPLKRLWRVTLKEIETTPRPSTNCSPWNTCIGFSLTADERTHCYASLHCRDPRVVLPRPRTERSTLKGPLDTCMVATH